MAEDIAARAEQLAVEFIAPMTPVRMVSVGPAVVDLLAAGPGGGGDVGAAARRGGVGF